MRIRGRVADRSSRPRLLLLAFVGLRHVRGSDGRADVPVKGKVTYKGKPLTKGRIIFEPDGTGKRPPARSSPTARSC